MKLIAYTLLVLIVLLTISFFSMVVFQKYAAVYTPRPPRPWIEAITGEA